MLTKTPFILFLLIAPVLWGLEFFVTESFAELPADTKIIKTVRGQLRPVQYAILASGISARINALSVKPGEQVKKGQKIALFECDYERAAEAVVLAKLNAAQAKLEVNKRLEKLHNVSGLEVQLSQAEVAVKEGEVRKNRAVLKECTLLAPFNGTVVGKFVQTHQYVNKGDPMLELVNCQNLEVEMVIPSQWLSEIETGALFTIHLDEIDTTIGGTVDRIIGKIDPVSQTVHIIGVLEQSPLPLLLGMSGIVRFDENTPVEQ